MNGKAAVLRHAFDRPTVVIECGMNREDHENPTDGFSTIYLAEWCRENDHGHVYSIDIDEQACTYTAALVEERGLGDWVTLVQGDAGQFIADFDGVIDFLYLDSADNPVISAHQLEAALPKLADRAVVAIDDVNDDWWQFGKGHWVIPFLRRHPDHWSYREWFSEGVSRTGYFTRNERP